MTGHNASCLFHLDINTAPQNLRMLFNKDSLLSFVQSAETIAVKLIGDVERLVGNDK